jgi:hypothetical protein
MFRRFRHAARVRFLNAVSDATRNALGPDLTALRNDVISLRDRVDAIERGLREHMTDWERRQRRELITAADMEAARTSAAWLQAQPTLGQQYFDKFDTLRAALAEAPQDGLYLEFGVYSGSTLRVIAEKAPAGCAYGFDSFEGLPETWRPGYETGTFATGDLPDVPGAELVVGWFDDTLPGFLEEHPEPVAFLHVDADLYSAARTVLVALAPRMRAGTVVLFDEYFNFPGWEEHEHRAWTQFVADTGLEFEYLGHTANDEQVAVRLLTAPKGQW